MDFLRYDFMLYALAAMLCIAPTYALAGTLVVDARMAFFSDTLSHAALCGVGLGTLLGVRDPLVAMVAFAIFLAVTLTLVKNRSASSTDTTIGVFSSSAAALGIVLLSRGGGFSRYASLLVGDLLAVTPTDLIGLAATLVFAVVSLSVLYNRLALTQLSLPLARSRGTPVFFVDILFACVVAVVVMMGIRWVGALIVNALMILPAAASRNIARSLRGYLLWAVVIAAVCGLMGVVLSYYIGAASGATAVLLMALTYGVTLTLRRRGENT